MKTGRVLLMVTGLLSCTARGQYAFLIDYFGPDGSLVTLDLTDPSQETVIGPAVPFLGDAEFGSDNTLYALPSSGTEFYQIDTTTAVVTQVGTSTPLSDHSWTGLAYDNTSGLLYASSTDGSEGAVYLIDPGSGIATQIGLPVTDLVVVDIAFNSTGQMYAHSLPHSLFEIDKATGTATYIGNTGIQGAGPWHGMDYCYENSTMYMATYNSINFVRTLRTVDLSTGVTTEVGEMTRGAGGFAITSPILGIEEGTATVNPAPVLRAFPNPSSGAVTLEFNLSVPTAAELDVIDLSGRIVDRIESGQLSRGEYSYLFTTPLENGVYTVRLVTGDGYDTVRLVMLR